jgi:tetratricopeptide (TPR) repeat protein
MKCNDPVLFRRTALQPEDVMRKMPLLAAAIILSATASVSKFAFAVEGANPAPPSSNTQQGTPSPKKKKKQKSSEEFLNGWHKAYALVYDKHDYEGGIAVLRAMGYDDNADVATLIGYASRKLGRYDDAKLWYERALAIDPNHAQTWSYYGMWQAEQGNILKAKDDLEKVRSICGTECREYVALKEAIDGTVTY